MPERVFEDGAVVCRADDMAQMMVRVRHGALRVEPAGTGPSEALLEPGQVFGAEALLVGAAYGATIRAVGRTVVEFVGRDAVYAALGQRPEIVRPLVEAAFEQAAFERAAVERPGSAAPVPQAAGGALRLMPAAPSVAEQTGADGIAMTSFPFAVGRKEARGEQNGARGIDLVLRDGVPYSLSRRHFTIERDGAGYLVRDCGSYHGTRVNGTLIGANGAALTAALVPGDNEIVAGKANSPIRFSLHIG